MISIKLIFLYHLVLLQNITLKFYHITQACPQHNSHEMGGWSHRQAGGASWCTEVLAFGRGTRASEGALWLYYYRYSCKYLLRYQASVKNYLCLCLQNECKSKTLDTSSCFYMYFSPYLYIVVMCMNVE